MLFELIKFVSLCVLSCYLQKEIAEPLMDLKQGIEILKQNRTFKCILSTLLSVGIFLNGAPVKGFQIEYLAKVIYCLF